MKNLILYFFLFVATIHLQAQTNKQEVVYLKNGGIIRGTILEYIPNQKLIIKSDANNTYTFDATEIDRIEQEAAPTKRRDVSIKQSGYYNATQVGIALGKTDIEWQQDPLNATLRTINGYQFNPRLAVGLGVGLDWYPEYRTYPIFVDVRGDVLPASKVTPIYYANVGYAAGSLSSQQWGMSDYKFKGGTMAMVGTGVKAHLGNIAWVFDVGYKFQQIKDSYNETWSGNTHNRNSIYRRFVVSTGITF